MGWTLLYFTFKPELLFRSALDQCFDTPIAQIADPTFQSERIRRPMNERTITNPLHSA
jgi:hypothetical protein